MAELKYPGLTGTSFMVFFRIEDRSGPLVLTVGDFHNMMILQQWQMGRGEFSSEATKKRYYHAVNQLLKKGIILEEHYNEWTDDKSRLPRIHEFIWEEYFKWAKM